MMKLVCSFSNSRPDSTMTFSVHPAKAPVCRARAIALTVALLYSAGSAAQSAPNAGQILRELQAPVDLAPPKSARPLQSGEQPAGTPPGGDVSFTVKTIRISGNAVIPDETLHALVAGLEGSTHTLNDLHAAAARITAYYRQQGYPVTRAYLPAQEITDGDITIAVIEGRIGAYRLKNQSRLSDARAGAYLETAKDGEVIRTAQIDRGLLLLNDTPGVGTARATLQPGASVGTSDLVVELTPGAAYSGSVNLDNYGNRYVGEYRLGGTLNINSPLRIGDVLSLNVLSSGKGLNYGRVAYQLPIGSDGLRLGAAYSDAVYKLGKEFETLDAHGKARSASVFAAYPFIRSQQSNLNGIISLEQKDLSDSVDATLTTTGKRAKLAAIGLQGTHYDGLGGGGFTSASLTATFGKLDILSPSALAIDAVSAQTNGGYERIAYSLSRLQKLTDATSLALSISGQEAGKNLDSSEKFSLGGALGVRAYPQGEGSGDEGYLATAELRYALPASSLGPMQLTGFIDHGSTRINHTPFAAGDNTRRLSGAGIGFTWNAPGNVIVRATVAWKLGSALPMSDVDRSPRAWVQGTKYF